MKTIFSTFHETRRLFLKRLMVFCGLMLFGSAFREKMQAASYPKNSAMKNKGKTPIRSADPFIGKIGLFAFNFAPRNWNACNGQVLPIQQYAALFTILSTTFGGNGTTTFALPDLRGRMPLQQGTGPGLSVRSLGETGGAETVTLLSTQIPAHNHALSGTFKQVRPRGTTPPVVTGGATGGDRGSVSSALSNAGSGLPHNNMSPYLAINMCVAIAGIFPLRP